MGATAEPTESAKGEPRRSVGPLARVGRIAFAVGLLAAVAWSVDWRELATIAANAHLVWFAVALFINLADRTWMAGKWLYLLGGLGIRARFLDALEHYFLGTLIGNAVQFQLGGDVARAIGLGARTGRRGTIVASVVVERVIGLFAAAVLAAIGVALLVWQFDVGSWRLPLLTSVLTMTAVSLIALGALLGPPQILERLLRWLPARARQELARLGELPRDRSAFRRVVVGFSLLTLGEQLVPLLVTYALARTFGLDLAAVAILAVMPIVSLFSRLPVAPESLGVREGLFVFLFGLIGLSPAASFAMALASRASDILVNGLGAGAFALVRHAPDTVS